MEYLSENEEPFTINDIRYFDYSNQLVKEVFNKPDVQKAMNQIKKMYSESEVKDQWANGDATQVHHIFPKSKFPQLAHYLENLIKLTATQHSQKHTLTTKQMR